MLYKRRKPLVIKDRTKANLFFKELVSWVTFAAAAVFPVRTLVREKDTELCILYMLQRKMKEVVLRGRMDINVSNMYLGLGWEEN